MRRLRSAALGVLFAVTALAGVVAAPSAGALVDGIRWDLPDDVIPVGFPLSVCATDAGAFEPGQEVRVDVMLGGVWTERATVTSPDHRSCVQLEVTEVLPKPGSYFLRARTEDGSGSPIAVNTAVTVTTSPQLGLINGVGGGDMYVYTTTPDKAVTVELTARGQAVDLQRKSGSQWLHVGRVTVADTGLAATARFKLPTKAGNVTYRLVGRPTTWTPLEITYPFVVHQTDYDLHKNYLVKARQYIGAFCPKTPLFVDTPIVSGPSADAFAYTAAVYDHVGDRPGITSRIDIASGLPAAGLRQSVVHACAQVVQSRTAVEGREAEELKKAAFVFPRERFPAVAQAGCMTRVVTGYIWDGRKVFPIGCGTSSQEANAERMWSYYGTRYQAVPYFYEAP